jgi:curli production assembly/transport component CsgE
MCKELIALAAALFCAVSASAASEVEVAAEHGTAATSGQRTVLPEPFTGVVSNQTITVAGREFYKEFIAAWRDKELSDRYTLSIHERPSARWGSQVWIEFEQRRVFQVTLPFSRAQIRPVGERAVEVTYQNVVEADVQRLLFRGGDLAADEI